MSKSQLRLLGLLLKKIIFGIVFQPLKKEKEEQFEPKINEQITAPFVRLVTEEGHDVVPLERAMAQAESLGMDLVEVSMLIQMSCHFVQERSNQALMKKKKECRQRGTWNGKKAYTDFYKNIVDMREFLNAPNGKQSPPVNNRSVADQYQSLLGGRTVFEMFEADAGFLTHNAVVFVCEILDCCPCFDFSDLELICDINARDHTGQTTLHWSAVRGTIQVAEADYIGY
ncbi:hypothetical protein ACS0TY_019844 [Phlomoides rotata]